MRLARAFLPVLAALALTGCGGGPRPITSARTPSNLGTPTNLTCVPYVEAATGIVLLGNAWRWWGEAAGRYARAHRPEVGAVLVFRPTSAIPLGHVAVVTAVLSGREILVAHANWVPYRINHDQLVLDVSAANNWSRVRVWYPPIDALGSTSYPVYGFVLPAQAVPSASLRRQPTS